MSADKPLFVTDRALHPHEVSPRGKGDTLVNKLEGLPYGVTTWGIQQLIEHPEQVKQLVELLANDPQQVKDELARMMAELKPLLPLFAERLEGWKVVEDLGSSLSDEWDPRVFLKDLVIGCVHPDGAEYMKGEELLAEARKRLAGRGGFSQHELAWFYRNWNDERIPGWFRKAVKSGEIYLIATETVLLDPFGSRNVLCLGWRGGQLIWSYGCLGSEFWVRCDQVLIPGNSS